MPSGAEKKKSELLKRSSPTARRTATGPDPVHPFFATCPKFMEDLLVQELQALGAKSVKETRAGAAFRGPLELAYRYCLWSRIANRVLLSLSSFPAGSREALYEGTRAIAWEDHLSSGNTLAVDCTLAASSIDHSGYAALVVKDAIVDYLRDRSGKRPSVDTELPDLRVNLHLNKNLATVSIDLSGGSLHRRAYRAHGGQASLKENVAAAILLRAGWPEIGSRRGAFVDPMCGAATLPIEAALMAGDIAPGLFRPHYGFLRWKAHRPDVWRGLIAEAKARRESGIGKLPSIAGYDLDADVLRHARANVAGAGLGTCVPEGRESPGLVGEGHQAPDAVGFEVAERVARIRSIGPVGEEGPQELAVHAAQPTVEEDALVLELPLLQEQEHGQEHEGLVRLDGATGGVPPQVGHAADEVVERHLTSSRRALAPRSRTGTASALGTIRSSGDMHGNPASTFASAPPGERRRKRVAASPARWFGSLVTLVGSLVARAMGTGRRRPRIAGRAALPALARSGYHRGSRTAPIWLRG